MTVLFHWAHREYPQSCVDVVLFNSVLPHPNTRNIPKSRDDGGCLWMRKNSTLGFVDIRVFCSIVIISWGRTTDGWTLSTQGRGLRPWGLGIFIVSQVFHTYSTVCESSFFVLSLLPCLDVHSDFVSDSVWGVVGIHDIPRNIWDRIFRDNRIPEGFDGLVL